ncbi:MAG: membrane dipeptidase [Hyphomicrobiaceae bacterium]
MNRRRFVTVGLAAALLPVRAVAETRPSVPVGDMHFHLFFFGPRPATSRALAQEMAAGRAALVAWSLVGDVPWLTLGRRGFAQKGTPAPREAVTWFQEELGRIKRYIAAQGLKIVATPADVDLALKGDPHIVLSVEGATFVDGDIAQLKAAHDNGVRQIQLVHYIRNSIGDFQTERPEHGGLTAFGRRVVQECDRLGILVDLAHCTPEAVRDALAVGKKPMVWSHSSVARGGTSPRWTMPAFQARQLTLASARAIAGKGGVVGLWAVRSDVGQTVGAYADRLAEVADLLGDDHAAFGTDMNGIVNPVIASFADLQRVVDHWHRRGLSEQRIRKLAIENYARVLKKALA